MMMMMMTQDIAVHLNIPQYVRQWRHFKDTVNQSNRCPLWYPLPVDTHTGLPVPAYFGTINMAAKPKFPGRRVNRAERVGIWYSESEGTSHLQSLDMPTTNRQVDDLIRRLDEFNNTVANPQEVITNTVHRCPPILVFITIIMFILGPTKVIAYNVCSWAYSKKAVL